ncbi:uncharacterized protein TNCV_1031921 [Trichonephila clavipes]|nr:uncharacterized protein TNCV_1031921 [Trichonephila clavipes]
MGPGQLEIMTVLSQVLYIFAPSRLIFNLQCNGVATNGLDGAMPRDAQIQGRLRTLATKQVELADEVEQLAYQLNEEAERTERPIRRLSNVMYGSTCADMQVDVMGECLSSIKHVVGTTSGCFYPRSKHWEVGGRPQCDKCGCIVRIAHSIVSRLWRQFQTTGTAIRGSVVVVHEEPHPQMTGTLSYRPEETGGRQREKSLDTRHRRLDDLYRVLPWPEDCTVVVCLHDALYGVCTFNACPSEKAFFVVPGTPELERQ